MDVALAASAARGVVAGRPRGSVRDLRGDRRILLDPFLGVGGESALFFIGVLVVALLGGVAPAALSAVLSGLLLNYFLVEPRHTFTIAEPDSAVTIVVLLVVAVAVAALVDGAAKRAREARRASQEAELLALFAGSVLRGADLEHACWSGSVRRTRSGR